MVKVGGKPVVLVTRPAAQNAEIIPDIEDIGCSAIALPMLNITSVTHNSLNIDSCTGLVFTSVRAVENFVVDNVILLLLPIYVVGEKTAKLLGSRGFKRMIYTAEDSIDMQLYFDTHTKEIPKNLWHICGEHVVNRFSVRQNFVNRHIVYRADKVPIVVDFTENLQLKMQDIDIVLLYSGRSAESFMELIKQYAWQEKCVSMMALCISRRTAERIKDVHWKCVHIAKTPHHLCMMDMLRKICQNQE